MDCVIFVLSALALSLSEADVTVKYLGQEPKTVLAGDNLTLSWTYNATSGDELLAVNFGIRDPNYKHKLDVMERHLFQSEKSASIKSCTPYCDNITWVGNGAKNIIAFKMSNISESVHGAKVSINIDHSRAKQPFIVDPQELAVAVKPEIRLIVSKTNTIAGDQVTIECQTIMGRPPPTISWYHKGNVLQGKNGRYLLNNKAIEEADAGSYKCKGTNDAGSFESETVNVTVRKNTKHNENGSVSEARGSSSGLSGGEIAGIVVGVLVVIVVVVVVVYVLRRPKNESSKIGKRTSGGDEESRTAMVSEPPQKDQVWL